jgi:SecD/SecF fusion protein
MRPSLGRILLYVVPVFLAAGVCVWAYYTNAFRLGVDLSGGTILVYEVDHTKTHDQVKGDELAAALKRRIDPADLYNITIRPVAGGDRVEIVMPFRGQQQKQAEKAAWDHLIAEVLRTYPPKDGGNPYADIEVGNRTELEKRVLENNRSANAKEVSEFITKVYQSDTAEKRSLSSEDIEHIKSLISQQGRLEFAIVANAQDDKAAIDRARAWIDDPANRADLERRAVLGEAPPPPRNEEGGDKFPVTTLGEPREYSYRWVEVGKEELYTLHLNNGSKSPLWQQAAKARAEHKALPPGGSGHDFLLYSRDIPNTSDVQRLSPRDRRLGKKYEYFILIRNPEGWPPSRDKEIVGDFLTSARRAPDEHGRWAVHFTFNPVGAERFYELTTLNRPPDQGTFRRALAVILDNQIQTAPALQSPIRSSGQITGDFTAQKVDELVSILRSGQLPATLKPQPVSENTIGATLGADTIRDGTISIVIAFLAVLAFMVFYYKFAGGVACVALLANLLMTVAFMVLVKATFTLPGLAGLVLTLGMAVDANVLIYERLREERERGASLPLALRNGYDRAFPTIIDTHLTSIFTAIVLYVVGNDQLKGFGITLTVGLIISLFTSLYMTRTIFDYWQSKNWLRKLSMRQLFHRPNIDFMGIRYYWFTATVVLTIVGAGLFIWRLPGADAAENESSVLNIDFIGGTAYTGRLTGEGLTIDQLRQKLEGSGLPDLSIEQVFSPQDTGGRSHLFTVRTAEKDRDKVQRIISEKLGDQLKRVHMDYTVAADGGSAELSFKDPNQNIPDFASPAQVTMLLTREAKAKRVDPFLFQLRREGEENDGRYSRMHLEMTEKVGRQKLETVLVATKQAFDNSPQPERLENFDSQLAANTQQIALYAILASWGAILLYLWFRFGSWTFGAAAVLCLIHDLFFTLGAIAACHYVYDTWFGHILGLGDFKLDLASVAALLTLVGYSVSDTIVVFDRIREVRGKNPALTPQMINDSVNQTLTRTVLSSLTVWLVVIVLYIWGGEGVHLFAFVMVVGVIVGTYSSIYIASPLLLMFGEGAPRRAAVPARGGVQPGTAPA